MSLKSLDEINREYVFERFANYKNGEAVLIPPSSLIQLETELPETDETAAAAEMTEERSNSNKRGTITIISDILFYLAIVLILFSAMTAGSGGAPKVIMGYSYFSVLSASMQDEIPKGSFILVKQTDPQDLSKGDNITYMRDRSMSVTHKIINIYENYQNSGATGFQTKGINNANPDEDIVYESNVVGKVILVVPVLGVAISYLAENIYIVFIIFGLCLILSFCIRGVFEKTERKQAQNQLRFRKAAVSGNFGCAPETTGESRFFK